MCGISLFSPMIFTVMPLKNFEPFFSDFYTAYDSFVMKFPLLHESIDHKYIVSNLITAICLFFIVQ